MKKGSSLTALSLAAFLACSAAPAFAGGHDGPGPPPKKQSAVVHVSVASFVSLMMNLIRGI